jgi:hypothetical protein
MGIFEKKCEFQSQQVLLRCGIVLAGGEAIRLQPFIHQRGI